MSNQNIMQAVSSGGAGDGALYTWLAVGEPDWAAADFPGPGTAAHVAVVEVLKSEAPTIASTAENLTVTNEDVVFVTDTADVTLPTGANRTLGRTITVIKTFGFFAVNVLGNGADVQTGMAGQTFTSFPLSSASDNETASVTYTWDGTQWVAIGAPGNVGQRISLSSSRVAALSDAGRVLHCNGGTVVYTVNGATFSDGDEVTFLFTGSSGSLTIATGTGNITINVEASKSLVMSTQYTWALLRCYGSRGDTPQLHVLTGELDAAP